mmetsp:Transcript_9563/g.23320  ORF Transcript_9563/g.23320 Transcript_9563/m.23320 type:complete len:208 (+) Transcript_9563:22-645(+)
MGKISVSEAAYLTAVLHALKYPAHAVNGVLLGSFADGGVRVEQAVPLLHSDLALAPMMEAGLALIDEHCAASKSQVVGYYHANAVHDNKDVSAVAKRIADKIHETVKERCKHEACLMVVDNLKLETVASKMRTSTDLGGECGVRVLVKNGGSGAWVASPEKAEIEGTEQGSAQARLVELVAKGKQASLVDFDNHIDNHSLGWMQPVV